MRKSRRLEENLYRKNQIKAEREKQEANPLKTGALGQDLTDLTRDVLVFLLKRRNTWMSLETLVESFQDSEIKVLTIIFVFEGFGMVKILDHRRVVFLGVQGSIQQFIAFVLQKVEDWRVKLEANKEKDKNLQKTEMLK